MVRSAPPSLVLPVTPPLVVTNPITAFANAGGGNVTVTAANTLAPGAVIVISGTTSYNGAFTVVSANTTTFTIPALFVANDVAGAWQNGGGLISGCSNTGATASIALAVAASRFIGVAPLAIFFDATSTTYASARGRRGVKRRSRAIYSS